MPGTLLKVDDHDTRRHSWPPFPVHIFRHSHDIDENPFEFFISAPENIDIEDDLRAGIDEAPHAPSLSPFHFRIKSPSSPVLEHTKSPIVKLKRWIERMERRYRHRPVMVEPASSPTVPEPASNQPDVTSVRGRQNSRLSPPDGARRSIRSHSARPRVWIRPGEDIWPVLEEEQDEVGLGISM